MTGVFVSFRRRHSRLLRCAAAVLLVAQAVSVLLAPSAEALASRSAPAHVEEGGTHLHHSHIPESCAACIALQLTGLPSHAPPPTLPAFERYDPPVPTTLGVAHSLRRGPNPSRAPPAIPLATR